MLARHALAALAIVGLALTSSAAGKTPPAKRQSTQKQRDAASYRHEGYLGALAPDNLTKPRPKLPFDLTGTWFIDISGGFNPLTFGPPYPELVRKGRNPRQEAAAARYRNSLGKCSPPGLPMVMTRLAPFALIQLPTAIYMVAGPASSFRTIYLDGRARTASVPTYNGQSIGQWEGDALVVTTRGLATDRHWIDGFIPISPEFQVVERIRMMPGGRTIEIEYVMTDPKIWKGEWRGTKRWNRQDRSDVVEDACVEARDAELPGTSRGQQALDIRARDQRAGRTKTARAEPVATAPGSGAPAPVLNEGPAKQLALAEPIVPLEPPAAKGLASSRAVPASEEAAAKPPSIRAPATAAADEESAAKALVAELPAPARDEGAAKRLATETAQMRHERPAKELATSPAILAADRSPAKELATNAVPRAAEETPAKPPTTRATTSAPVGRPPPKRVERPVEQEPAKPPLASPPPPIVVARAAPPPVERAAPPPVARSLPPVARAPAPIPAAPPAPASHALAMFDQATTVSLKGRFVELRSADPHSWIELEVANTRGTIEHWNIEVDTSIERVRRAWQRMTLNPGEPIIVVINPLRDGDRGGLLRAVLMPDGRVVDVASPADARPINSPPLN